MSSVVPAIIPASQGALLEALRTFSSFSREVQVDIVDGVFVPSVSWPYAGGEDIADALPGADLGGMTVEFDLMIQNPEETLDLWSVLHPSRIVVHIESTGHIEDIFAHKAAHGYTLGIALNNDTDLESLFALPKGSFQYIQLMGIDEIGVQGQPFDERVLTRIREIRLRYPDIEISIDGSVNEETLPLLKEAGANRFVAGSAILKAADREAMYKKLSMLAS
jgi:ribulose-phosphate 3-epimerase